MTAKRLTTSEGKEVYCLIFDRQMVYKTKYVILISHHNAKKVGSLK